MANRNIIVVGRGNSVTRISYDALEKKANAQDYNGVVTTEVTGSTRINCLAVVNRTMEQLTELDLSKDTNPVLILTVGMVSDMVHNGTALYWIKNGGKKNDGTAVNAEEMGLWNRFYELYAQLLTNVVFKNVSDIKIPKNPRYAITMEQRVLNDYIEKAWDRVKVTAPEIEESEDEAL